MFYILTPLLSGIKYEMSYGVVLYKYKEIYGYIGVDIVLKKGKTHLQVSVCLFALF